MSQADFEHEASAEYAKALQELDKTRPKINMLTMLAEDYKQAAIAVVRSIEQYLNEVPNTEKLCVFYLIDSICKTYPNSTYVSLFQQGIVSNFTNCYKVSDSTTRRSLYKLRSTWEQNKIFPLKKLKAIDLKVREIDPSWPISPNNDTSQKSTSNQNQNQNVNSQPSMHVQQPPNKRLRRTQLAPQEMPINNAPIPLVQPMPINPYVMIPEIQCDPSILINNMPPMDYINPANIAMAPVPAQLIAPQMQSLSPHLVPPPPPPLQTHQVAPSPQQLLVESLYGGKQCTNCSSRFDDTSKYSKHLDWHFRQNSDKDKKLARRKWYYPLDLWVQFREIHDDEQQDDDTQTDSNNKVTLISEIRNEVSTAQASTDDDKNICSVCREAFEKFWAEDEEEWQLKNAKLHEDGRIYHPLCLLDLLQG